MNFLRNDFVVISLSPWIAGVSALMRQGALSQKRTCHETIGRLTNEL